jgi:hypothetical protein
MVIMEGKENEEKSNEQKSDSGELDAMEIEVFRQHWRSLNTALAEIRELRGSDVPEVDPIEFVKHEVGNLKNQFSELKEILTAIQQNQSQPQAQPQQQYQRFQPVQTTVPILPYYSTPNFAPMLPINQ